MSSDTDPNADAKAAAEARYRALCSHDARFDGCFFIGVTTTGIYCRPVCRVRTPRRENCRFFDHSAQAERAGFRPCLRCRPELAPLDRHWSAEDASTILVQQATRLLDDPQAWQSGDSATLGWLVARLGVSDRHLRRVFARQLGVSPLQYLQTRKLLTAKQLLGDTRLPVWQVAETSGFGSLRRFHAAFQARYALNPTQMRRNRPPATARWTESSGCTVRLAWRPPYDATAMLRFLAARQLPGVECVTPDRLALQRTVRMAVAGQTHTGWLTARFDPPNHRLLLRVSDSLQPVLPRVIWRMRELLDLDADPQAINTVLHTDFPTGDGLRVPGCFDGFELAVRAVLGQQITVAAACTLATRLLERFGEPISTPDPALNRLFPPAHALAQAEPQVLGELGIVRQRQRAILALSRAVDSGELDLSGHADLTLTTQRLLALPGIGPWTAQLIALRALHWPDAWPVGDVAVHRALGLSPDRGRAAEQAAARIAAAWRPWRSYAVIRAWAGCRADPATSIAPEDTP